MDQAVLDAIIRWPNVPAVYGWLSLNPRGQWRLHPAGDGCQGGPGVGISNTQILGFIDRNYACDLNGAYYFQNGPQRVHVRVDSAPFVLRVLPDTHMLCSHTSLVINRVSKWFIDEQGHLFADTDIGAALIDDRDLLTLSELLEDTHNRPLLEILEDFDGDTDRAHLPLSLRSNNAAYAALCEAAPLKWIQRSDIPAKMKFVANPSMP